MHQDALRSPRPFFLPGTSPRGPTRRHHDPRLTSRPASRRFLPSGSCSSAGSSAARFPQRPAREGLSCGSLGVPAIGFPGGLAPPVPCPCWAQQERPGTRPGLIHFPVGSLHRQTGHFVVRPVCRLGRSASCCYSLVLRYESQRVRKAERVVEGVQLRGVWPADNLASQARDIVLDPDKQDLSRRHA